MPYEDSLAIMKIHQDTGQKALIIYKNSMTSAHKDIVLFNEKNLYDWTYRNKFYEEVNSLYPVREGEFYKYMRAKNSKLIILLCAILCTGTY